MRQVRPRANVFSLLRVVYIGRVPDLGIAVALSRHRLAAVVSLRGRSLRARARAALDHRIRGRDAMARLAGEAGAAFWPTEDVNAPGLLRRIEALQPDLILCGGWPQRFGAALLGAAPLGCVNAHPSLLPRHRGPNPCAWVLLNGEPVSGLTFHRMTGSMDAGDVLAQVEVPVLAQDDAGSLLRRCLAAGVALLPGLLGRLERCEVAGFAQDPAAGSCERQPLARDVEVDFGLPTRVLHDRIRARLPSPGVRLRLGGRERAVLASLPLDAVTGSRPGDLVASAGRFLRVATSDGSLILETRRPSLAEVIRSSLRTGGGWERSRRGRSDSTGTAAEP